MGLDAEEKTGLVALVGILLTFGAIVLAKIAFLGAVIWGIVKLVQHFTA